MTSLSCLDRSGHSGGFPDREPRRILQTFVLEPGHTAEFPRLTRLTSPVDLHDTGEYANGPVRAPSLQGLADNLRSLLHDLDYVYNADAAQAADIA